MSIQPGVGYTFTSSSQGTNFNVEQQWASFTPVNGDNYKHPFQIIDVTYDAAGSVFTYKVVPGTLNNEVPQILEDGVWVALNRTSGSVPDWPLSTLTFVATKSFVYLRAGVDTLTNFPGQDNTDPSWPRIISSGTTLTDTDTYGYILLAEITEVTGPAAISDQYVTGSLYGDRIKLGTLTAKYYYSRV